jgi:hypothetical protein
MTDLTSLATIITRRPDLMTSELSETELVMLNIERGSYYGMADTAKDIWNQLDTPRSIAAVCDQLMTQYAVDRETCEREVLAFVKDMLNDDLVQVVAV